MRAGILFLVMCASPLFCELQEPYRSIQLLPFDEHGWFRNAVPLGNLIDQIKPVTVIEVGSWLGLSTRFIAKRIPQGGRVYAVDTWLGSSQAVLREDPRLCALYQQFLSNVIHAGLTEEIIPIRMSSKEAVSALHIKADLCYIDAAHDTSSVIEDILQWYPHVVDGGFMCGDDWNMKTVRAAVVRCSKKLSKKIASNGNFWWYHD